MHTLEKRTSPNANCQCRMWLWQTEVGSPICEFHRERLRDLRAFCRLTGHSAGVRSACNKDAWKETRRAWSLLTNEQREECASRLVIRRVAGRRAEAYKRKGRNISDSGVGWQAPGPAAPRPQPQRQVAPLLQQDSQDQELLVALASGVMPAERDPPEMRAVFCTPQGGSAPLTAQDLVRSVLPSGMGGPSFRVTAKAFTEAHNDITRGAKLVEAKGSTMTHPCHGLCARQTPKHTYHCFLQLLAGMHRAVRALAGEGSGKGFKRRVALGEVLWMFEGRHATGEVLGRAFAILADITITPPSEVFVMHKLRSDATATAATLEFPFSLELCHKAPVQMDAASFSPETMANFGNCCVGHVGRVECLTGHELAADLLQRVAPTATSWRLLQLDFELQQGQALQRIAVTGARGDPRELMAGGPNAPEKFGNRQGRKRFESRGALRRMGK